VETFIIPARNPYRSKRFLVARWCLWFGLLTVAYFIVESIWPSTANSAPERLFVALLFSTFMCAFGFRPFWKPSAKHQDITIDGDMIVVKKLGGFYKLPLADIRTVIETKSNILRDGGLIVSNKPPFSARMWGRFIWIPEYAPEYAQLKNIVEFWKNSTAKSIAS
jgi:hypothetical protein